MQYAGDSHLSEKEPWLQNVWIRSIIQSNALFATVQIVIPVLVLVQ